MFLAVNHASSTWCALVVECRRDDMTGFVNGFHRILRVTVTNSSGALVSAIRSVRTIQRIMEMLHDLEGKLLREKPTPRCKSSSTPCQRLEELRDRKERKWTREDSEKTCSTERQRSGVSGKSSQGCTQECVTTCEPRSA